MKDLLFLVFLIVDLDLIKCSSALLVNARIAQAVIGVFLAPTILGHISSKYVLTALAILKGAILGERGVLIHSIKNFTRSLSCPNYFEV